MTVYCLGLFVVIALCNGAIPLDESPKNATVFVGEEVSFQCRYSGSFDLPRWRINGKYYYLKENLPQSHSSDFVSLTVSKAQLSMDGWEYVCFFITLASGKQNTVESYPAYLTVRNNSIHTSTGVQMLTIASEVTVAVPTIMSIDATQVIYFSHKSTSPKETLQAEIERGGLHSSVYIAIGAGITSAAVLVLVIMCITILLILRSLRQSPQAQSKANEVIENTTGIIYEQMQDSADNTKEPVYDEVSETIDTLGNVAYTTPRQLRTHTATNMRETGGEGGNSASLSSEPVIHMQHCSIAKQKEPVYDEILDNNTQGNMAYTTPHQLPTATDVQETGTEVGNSTSMGVDHVLSIHLQHSFAANIKDGPSVDSEPVSDEALKGVHTQGNVAYDTPIQLLKATHMREAEEVSDCTSRCTESINHSLTGLQIADQHVRDRSQ